MQVIRKHAFVKQSHHYSQVRDRSMQIATLEPIATLGEALPHGA